MIPAAEASRTAGVTVPGCSALVGCPLFGLCSRSARRFFEMSDHIYKKLELVGSSTEGIEAAVQNALSRAGKTIRNMRWFEVTETRGHIEDNQINHWQVTVKVGFTLDR